MNRRAEGYGFVPAIGKRLREVEVEFPNRAAAAAAAGVSKSSFQRWLAGDSDISAEGLARFAHTTGYSLEWLAFGIEPKKRFHRLDDPGPDRIVRDRAEAIYDEIVSYINAFLEAKGWTMPQRNLHRLAEQFLDRVIRYDEADTRAAIIEVMAELQMPAAVDQAAAPGEGRKP